MTHDSNIYYFTDTFDKFILSNLDKNISIIYRNYEKNYNFIEINKIKQLCKINRRKFFISNNIKLAVSLNCDGVYLPSFNKLLNYKNQSLRKNFNLIGSAHNEKEIKNKILQGCSKIFVSSLFFNKKNKRYLDVIKFNNMTKNYNTIFIALGGINEKNIKKLKLLNSAGYASISYIKKKALSKIDRAF